MEFGFSRFLEMFEERFGRTVTTAVLGLVGTAVALYSLKVTIEAILYVYHLASEVSFMAALRQESAPAHLILFVVQIAIMAIIGQWVWTRLHRRYLAAVEANLEKLLEQSRAEVDKFERQVEEFENRENKVIARMEELKARQDALLAKKN